MFEDTVCLCLSSLETLEEEQMLPLVPDTGLTSFVPRANYPVSFLADKTDAAAGTATKH